MHLAFTNTKTLFVRSAFIFCIILQKVLAIWVLVYSVYS